MTIKESALRLILKARDALSAPVQKSSASLESLRGEARALKQQLSSLENQQKLLNSFKKQTEAVRAAGVVYRESKARVEQLAAAYAQSTAPSKKMTQELERARAAVSRSNDAYQSQRGKLASLRKSLSDTGLSNRDFAAQQNRVEKELKETSAAFTTAEQKAKSAARQFRRTGLKDVGRDAGFASGSVASLGRRLAGLAGAAAGIYTVKRAITGLLETGSRFESLAVQMESVMGSAAAGEEAMEWIQEFTANTPYQLNEVAEAFTRLKAFGLDPMDGTMQAIVDQSAKLGGGMERLNGISLALGQAWAKQKLQGEEILQLVERGVPVWDLLQKATGKNTVELQKLSAAGALGRDVMAQLIAEIGQSAEGAAAKNMTLLAGYVSNLKDQWTAFVNEIAQSGAMDYAKEQLAALLDTIAEMRADGRLKELAKKISDTFVGMAEAIRASFANLTFDGVVEKINTAFSSIVSSVSVLNKIFSTAGNVISVFWNGFQVAVQGAASAILYTFAEIVNGWAKLLNLFGAEDIAATMNEGVNKLRALGAAYATEAEDNAEDVKNSLVGIYKTLADEATSAQEILKKGSEKTAEQTQNDEKENQEELKKTGTAYLNLAGESTAASDDIEKSSKKTRKAITETNKAVEQSGEKIESRTRSLANGLAGIYNNITQSLHNLSAAAHNAFVGGGLQALDTTGSRGQLKELQAQLQRTQADIAAMGKASPTGWLGNWLNEVGLKSARITESFLTQKIALEELMLGYENGEISTASFIQQAERASKNMDLLNDADLEKLNKTIGSARDSMAQLRESSRGTLDSLQDELDKLQGREEDIEQRRYQRQQADLRSQLAEAQAAGDSTAINNLQKALSLSSTIFSENQRIAQNEQREEYRKQLAEFRAAANSGSASTTTSPTQQKTIRLESSAGVVNVNINASDEEKLLDALKSAGMRAV